MATDLTDLMNLTRRKPFDLMAWRMLADFVAEMPGTTYAAAELYWQYVTNAAAIRLTANDKMGREIRSVVRRMCQEAVEKNTPVAVVPNGSWPILLGSEGHYESPTGKRIQYPNAYRNSGGKCVYVRSTIRVEVGAETVLLLLAGAYAPKFLVPTLARGSNG